MNFAADICKNAVVTDWMVMKDKKAFSRQWNARDGLFKPRRHLGFHVRDDPYHSLTHTHTHTIITSGWLFVIIGFFDGDSNPTKSLGLRWERERERECVLTVMIWRLMDRTLFTFFLPWGPTLPLQGSCLFCEQIVLSLRLQVIRWDFTLSELNWLCHSLGRGIRFWTGS